MNGLSGGPDHHAREARTHLDTIEETLDFTATSGMNVQQTFMVAGALAKAVVHLNELPAGAQKKALSRRFNELKSFVNSAKGVVAADLRRCQARVRAGR
jgi:hypothetical protein